MVAELFCFYLFTVPGVTEYEVGKSVSTVILFFYFFILFFFFFDIDIMSSKVMVNELVAVNGSLWLFDTGGRQAL